MDTVKDANGTPIKVGDRVRKKNGGLFYGGIPLATVDRIGPLPSVPEGKSVVWLKENGMWITGNAVVVTDEWDAAPDKVADETILDAASKPIGNDSPERRHCTPAPGYPDDNPKTILGTAKPSISSVPPVAMFVMGQAMRDGKAKYGPMNWREKRVTSSVYFDAAMRHLLAWWDGEEEAQDSGVHHLGHAMACLAILVDAQHGGHLNDDRPPTGTLPKFLSDNTKVNS
jgi:hypothetical protein